MTTDAVLLGRTDHGTVPGRLRTAGGCATHHGRPYGC